VGWGGGVGGGGAARSGCGVAPGAGGPSPARRMKCFLGGEGAPPAVREKILAEARSGSGVRNVIHLRTLYLGPDDLLVALKIDFDRALAVREVEQAINALEARVRAAVPQARRIYVEPDTP